MNARTLVACGGMVIVAALLADHQLAALETSRGTPVMTSVGFAKVASLPGEVGNTVQSLGHRLRSAYHAWRLERDGSVTVGGYVHVPGAVRYRAGISLDQALLQAGGINGFGSTKRVRVTRGTGIMTLDMTKPTSGKFSLEKNDTIEVPAKVWIGR